MVNKNNIIKGSIPLLFIWFIIIMKGVKMRKDLEEIENKIKELKKRKEEILNEEKERKERER